MWTLPLVVLCVWTLYPKVHTYPHSISWVSVENMTLHEPLNITELAVISIASAERSNNESELYIEDDLIVPVHRPHGHARAQGSGHESDEVYQIDLLTSDEEDSLTSASTSACADHEPDDAGGGGADGADGVPPEIELRTDHAATAAPPIDMSDFVALIPAVEVKAIAANYYRHDAEVQRAYDFLSGNDFALLKQHIIAVPEVAAFLKYLNSSGLDVVGFVYTLTNLTSKPNASEAQAAQQWEHTGGAVELRLENEIEKTQHATLTTASDPATATTKVSTSITNTIASGISNTTLPPDATVTTTTKEALNGLNGLVESIMELLPQDQILTTFFDKVDSDEQFAKLVDSIGSPLFAKILSDMENSVQLRNLIFTLHNNGIYITRIVDSLKTYFFLGTF